jgi:hypothetical protein
MLPARLLGKAPRVDGGGGYSFRSEECRTNYVTAYSARGGTMWLLKGGMRLLRAVEAGLSYQPPLLFLLLYLLTGFGFGWWYYAQPAGQFYAPYARFEPAARADAATIIRSLGALIQADVKDEPASYWQLRELTEPGSPARVIDPALVHTANFEMLDDGTVRFDVLVPTYLTDATGRPEHSEPYQIWMNVSFPALGGPIASDTAHGSFYPLTLHTEKYTVPAQAQETAFKLVFNRLIEITIGDDGAMTLTQHHGTVSGGAPLLRVDADTGYRLFDYYFGVHGQPERFSGNFGRMLYFSAVVITTLGLGDIVPLTDRARALVAGEAVLGIIFVGLFINAAASRARR